jgi:DNA-binding MarR family transcriptional regulator
MASELNELIHQPLRLKIMATLAALPPREPIEFTRLRGISEATDGNLGTHLSALEKAGYVRIEKDFVGKKPRTRVAMSPAGRRAFQQHVAFLQDLIDTANQPA